MAACEKCWADAFRRSYGTGRSQAECYQEILEERKDSLCSPKEQAGQEMLNEDQKEEDWIMAETKTKAVKKNVLYDVLVTADVSGMCFSRHHATEEDRAQELDAAVKEFEIFLRDHRSQDLLSLSVDRQYKDVCSECGGQWETDRDAGRLQCSNCGADVADETTTPTEKE